MSDPLPENEKPYSVKVAENWLADYGSPQFEYTSADDMVSLLSLDNTRAHSVVIALIATVNSYVRRNQSLMEANKQLLERLNQERARD